MSFKCLSIGKKVLNHFKAVSRTREEDKTGEQAPFFIVTCIGFSYFYTICHC